MMGILHQSSVQQVLLLEHGGGPEILLVPEEALEVTWADTPIFARRRAKVSVHRMEDNIGLHGDGPPALPAALVHLDVCSLALRNGVLAEHAEGDGQCSDCAFLSSPS